MPGKKRKSSKARPTKEQAIPRSSSDSVISNSITPKLVTTSPFVVTLSRHAGNDAQAAAAAAGRTVWHVRPDSIWASLAKYLKEHTYSVHQYALISRPQPLPQPLHPIEDYDIQCIARILEIRALDPTNVYVRVYWVYRPHEMPGGKQDHHGRDELIATNHMEIVDALRVLSPIDITRWREEEDSRNPQGGLYWRQVYDVTIQSVSAPRAHCTCNQPINPERFGVQCTNHRCMTILHRPCLIDSELRRLNQLRESSQPDSSKHFDVKLTVSQRPNHKGTTRHQIIDLSSGRTWEQDVRCLKCGTRIYP